MSFSEKSRKGRAGNRTITPGFRYDGKERKAYIDLCVPGTAGRKRIRSVVPDVTCDEGLSEWKRLRAEAKAPPTPKAEITLRSYFEDHWPTMQLSLSPKGAAAVGQAMKSRVLPFLGDKRLESINLAEVRDWAGQLRAKNYAPASVNGALSTLRKFLKDAVAREVLAVYPIKGRLPRQKEEILRLEMTGEEETRFLRAFDDRDAFRRAIEAEYRADETEWLEEIRTRQPNRKAKPPLVPEAIEIHWQRFRWLKPFFIIALETGLRRGDLMSLHWSSVDEKAGRIRVTMGKTKVDAVIPISPRCREAVKECRERLRNEELVFVTDEGTPIAESTLERAFALAKRLAKITRRLRFHDLRHTWASKLASRGVSIQVISKALGHTSTKMSERYAKPSDEAMNAIVTALARGPMNTRTNTRTPVETTKAPILEPKSNDLRELLVSRPGLEPGTPCLKGRCSNQLS